MNPRQLALDLGHRPALGQDDFLVAGPNAEAVAWLDRWPDWPSAGLVLHGPAGCGKSHLVNVWRARSGARAVARSDLTDDGVAALIEGAAHAALDDAEAALGAGAAAERALFHLYNALKEGSGTLLVAARTPPARWRIGLADLASRMSALPAVAVRPPDDALIAAVLVKLFADRQLQVDQAVLDYLTARMERSFGAAQTLVDAIDREALAHRRRITVPFVAEVLQTLGPKHQA